MIIRRYLTHEIVNNLIGVLAVVLLIFVSQHFIRYLSDAAAGTLPAGLVFKILGYFLISSLVFLLPLVLFLAVLLAVGRLYKDSEMAAMEACGIGLPRILRSVLTIALGFAAIVMVMAGWVAPWAEEQQHGIRDKAALESEFSFIQPGRFQEIRNGQGVFYIEDLETDGKTMRQVFVQTEDASGLNIFVAKRGSLASDGSSGDHHLLLEDGYRYRWLPDNGGFRVYQYERGGMRITASGITVGGRSVAARPSAELWASDQARDIAEWQWRCSMPISGVLLALMAVPLARTRPRQGRFARLFLALGIAVMYYNALMFSKTALAQGQWPAWLGLWWVHVVYAAGAVVLFIHYFGWHWSLQQIRPRWMWPRTDSGAR